MKWWSKPKSQQAQAVSLPSLGCVTHSLAPFGLANDWSVYMILRVSLRPPGAWATCPFPCGVPGDIHHMPNGQKQWPGHILIQTCSFGQHICVCRWQREGPSESNKSLLGVLGVHLTPTHLHHCWHPWALLCFDFNWLTSEICNVITNLNLSICLSVVSFAWELWDMWCVCLVWHVRKDGFN